MVDVHESMAGEITPGRQAALDVVQRMQEARLLKFGNAVEIPVTAVSGLELTPDEKNVFRNNPDHIPYLDN